MITFSEQALDIIRHFESCLKKTADGRYTAYQDGGGVWTIGWGTIQYPNGRRVIKGDTITGEQAETYLLSEVEEKAFAVRQMVKVPINQHMFDALVSFSYNVGTGALKDSTLLRRLNRGDYHAAAQEFERWRFDNGKEVRGLLRRRWSERNLFCGFPNPIITSI